MKKPISCAKMLSLIGKEAITGKKLAALRQERKQLLKRLEAKEELLELERQVAGTITEAWEDEAGTPVPVCVRPYDSCYGQNIGVQAYGEGLRLLREVRIYPDAHTSVEGEGKEWHLTIQVWKGFQPVYPGGRAYFFWAKSPGELLPVVRKFIVTGNVGVLEEASAKWRSMHNELDSGKK